jgi:2-dehydropantoate 2-reductase
MKICIVGAGAIGGMLAVRLSQSGAEVSVVARGAQLSAIQNNGRGLPPEKWSSLMYGL